MITAKLSKNNVDAFYSEETDGILVLRSALHTKISERELKEWFLAKRSSYEEKPEQYIENNQEVFLVFNGTWEELSTIEDTVEKVLHDTYIEIRNELEKHSDVPFRKGNRIETKLIRYPVSSLGINAHQDLSSSLNCVALMNLYGATDFYTALDKSRNGEKKHPVLSGDITLMRGPRTKDENHLRPIHYVLDIPEERLVCVFREIDDEIERVINKDNWRGF